MHVVATAGHVDHGKSTLVRALTGHDPDRLEEERRRGLSIELGYCWTELRGAGEVAFVDVPGHERFLATMLAGAAPVPAVMFVVAADDPWMPQAAEHLAALDALGVRSGVLVVTRSDLADPAPALRRAREELARTTLSRVPEVVVSARSGAGLDELRATLVGELSSMPTPDPTADVRLWVDRSFSVHGTGTVVTGTLAAGTLHVGDALTLHGRPVRVRGLQCLGKSVDIAHGAARVALALGGATPDDVGRGDVIVTPHAFEPTTTLDVRLSSTGRLPDRPLLHLGTAALGARARPLGPTTARLTLDRPLPLRIGDRGLLRDPGSRELWGIEVLDPAPPALRRRGAATSRHTDLGATGSTLDSQLKLRSLARLSLLKRIGVDTDLIPPGTVVAGDWLLGAALAKRLRERLVTLVNSTTTQVPPGLAVAAVAQRLGLPDDALVPALVEPPLAVRGGRVEPEGVALAPHLLAAADALASDFAAGPFRAPEAGRLASLELDPRDLAVLHRAGRLLRLSDQVVLRPGADIAAMEVLRTLTQPFSVSQARQSLDSTRRVVLPLLAHLDRTGQTVRLPDDRRRVR